MNKIRGVIVAAVQVQRRQKRAAPSWEERFPMLPNPEHLNQHSIYELSV